MRNLGLTYKSGLGSCLQQGYRGPDFNEAALLTGDTAVHRQPYALRVSGVNQTYLANEPFIFTYRVYFDSVYGPTGGGGLVKSSYIYFSNGQITKPGDFLSTNSSGLSLSLEQSNDSFLYFQLISLSPGLYTGNNAQAPFTFSSTLSIIKRRVPYNITLYKKEGSFSSATSFSIYINGKKINTTDRIYTGPNSYLFSSITFNVISFGGNPNLGNFYGTEPHKVFNNSVFRVDTGLTTSYVDDLALQLHRVDNYIHLLPTSHTINPSNVGFYFPFYIKEGKDIRDYYNPNKKFYVRLGFGADPRFPDVDFTNGTSFVNATTASGPLTFTSKTASVYKGPYNVWRKPYPPYDPYI